LGFFIALNFHGCKNGGHFERWDAINTFIFSEILLACAKEYLTAAMYYCQVEIKSSRSNSGGGRHFLARFL